jgi:hypothetical protein
MVRPLFPSSVLTAEEVVSSGRTELIRAYVEVTGTSVGIDKFEMSEFRGVVVGLSRMLSVVLEKIA